jgi:hypothetical protein
MYHPAELAIEDDNTRHVTQFHLSDPQDPGVKKPATVFDYCAPVSFYGRQF